MSLSGQKRTLRCVKPTDLVTDDQWLARGSIMNPVRQIRRTSLDVMVGISGGTACCMAALVVICMGSAHAQQPTKSGSQNLVEFVQAIKQGFDTDAFASEEMAQKAIGIREIDWGSRAKGMPKSANSWKFQSEVLSAKQARHLESTDNLFWNIEFDNSDQVVGYSMVIRHLEKLGCVTFADVEKAFGPQKVSVTMRMQPLHGAPPNEYNSVVESRSTTPSQGKVIYFQYVYPSSPESAPRPECLSLISIRSGERSASGR
jgi:hypothetical protein